MRRSAKERALAVLRPREKISNVALSHACGLRYGAVIFELRNDGWDIRTIKTRDPAVFLYANRGHSKKLAEERSGRVTCPECGAKSRVCAR